MEITYWELAGFLAMTPFLIYIAYWKGWKQGKREGYQPKGWFGDHFIRNFPFAAHSSFGAPHCPVMVVVMADLSGLTHVSCTGVEGCAPCAGLPNSQTLQCFFR